MCTINRHLSGPRRQIKASGMIVLGCNIVTLPTRYIEPTLWESPGKLQLFQPQSSYFFFVVWVTPLETVQCILLCRMVVIQVLPDQSRYCYI